MSRGDPQILLRVSQELKDAIHAAAKLNKRSVNSELLVSMERVYLPKRREETGERLVEHQGFVLPGR
jgi:hypothetical protein